MACSCANRSAKDGGAFGSLAELSVLLVLLVLLPVEALVVVDEFVVLAVVVDAALVEVPLVDDDVFVDAFCCVGLELWLLFHLAAKFCSAVIRSVIPPDNPPMAEPLLAASDDDGRLAVAEMLALLFCGAFAASVDARRFSNNPDKAPPAPRLELNEDRKFAVTVALLLSALVMEGLDVDMAFLSQAVL